MSTVIKLRRGTASEWASNGSTILASGEPGFELDTGRLKIGDGITAWSGLYYATIIPTGLIAGSGVDITLGSNGEYATISVTGNVNPFSIGSIDLHNGGLQNAQILQFDDSNYQSVITGPVPPSGNNAQRLIIQGQKGVGGEGGDVYVWGGDADTNGGDIKIYAGDADDPSSGYGGYVNIDGGSGHSQGGNVEITAGSSATQGGNIIIEAGYGTNINGTVFVRTGGNNKQWSFSDAGSLIFPNGTTVAVGTFDNGLGGNDGISLNCWVGYELNWQAGHLISTADNGVTAETIHFDSPIDFPGSGVSDMGINSSGLIFPDSSIQTVAWTGSVLSSQVTDFNSSVSGLLPVKDIVAGTGISISSTTGIYTITSTGSGVLADQSSSIVTNVFNNTGYLIPKMSAVYINGGQGDQPTVQLAIATGDATSAGTYGVTYEAISNMSLGKVIVMGALTGVNTDPAHGGIAGATEGSVLYLSPSTSGALTTTKPSAPNHIVTIGNVVRVHQNAGVIEVRIVNGFELEELHNVAISGVTNGQFLQYNSSTSLWVPTSSGNFTTLQVSGTNVSVSGHTHTASQITDFGSSVSGLLPTIANSGDNRILTSTGTSTGVNAESNLTFDGTTLGVTGVIDIDNLRLDGNTISSTNSNGNIVLAPNGTGDVQIDADTLRVGDSNTAATITTNGTGNLTLSTNSGTNSGSILINQGSNGNIELTPNGTGDVYVNADTLRVGDSNAAATITTNGTGNLTINTNNGTNAGSIVLNQGSNGNITITPNGNGNVGVNVTPSSKFHVLGTSNSENTAIISVESNGSQCPLMFKTGGTNRAYVKGDDGGNLAFGANGVVVFEAGGFGFSYEKMKITTDGKVGIGTSNPAYTLDVNGGAQFTQMYPSVVSNGTVSGSVATDVSAGQIFDMTISGSTTLSNPTNSVDGVTIRWRIQQDGTGGHSMALDTKFQIPSSASNPLPWSTGANEMDILAATYHAGRDKWDIVAFVPGY